MKKDKLIPKRRFKEFENDGAWEQRKVSELIEDIADGPFGSNLKTIHYTGEKEARIIQLSNIGENGWQDENVRYTTFEHAREIKRSIVNSGELVMAKMMPAGLTIECPNAEKMYVLSSDAVRFKLDEKYIDTKYFVSMTKSNYFLDQISNDMQGSTRTRTSISKIRKMNIPTPSLKEQKRIGDYFEQLDTLITLHQRKLKKLKDLKLSYLSEFFPKEGEKYPKLRFKGFTDAWEQRKLGELAQYRRGSFPQPYGKEEWYDGDGAMPFVQVVDVTDQLELAEKTKQRISRRAQPMSIFVSKGSVIVTLQGSIGRVAITQYDCFVDRTLLIFERYNKPINEVFWAYTIQMKFDIEKEKAPGGTIKTITKEALTDFIVSLPSLEEQQKIGNFFNNLDNLITLHQRKLEKIENIKKAYLNEMFI